MSLVPPTSDAASTRPTRLYLIHHLIGLGQSMDGHEFTRPTETESSFFFIYAVIAFVVAFCFNQRRKRRQPDLSHIPTAGYESFLLSWVSAIEFTTNASRLLQKGYDDYKPGIFKVASLNRWTVVVTGQRLIEEMRKAPDDHLSFPQAANEVVQIPYTIGQEITEDPYHVPIVGVQLTRSMHALVPAMRDEMIAAFLDKLPSGEPGEWTSLPAVETMMYIISRISNRVFVGLPLCRDPGYIDLNMKFAGDVLKGAIVVGMFPKFIRPLVARLFTNLPRTIRRMMSYLKPIVGERQRMNTQGGDPAHKTNDMLTWLMNESRDDRALLRDLSLRILAVNFAAIHTSSMSFTHALFHLASRPEHAQSLRDEVEAVVRKEGWNKAAVDKMQRLDSFLRESMRFSGLRSCRLEYCLPIACTGVALVAMMRKATRSFVFSDGTDIPEGTFLFAASQPIQKDPARYPEPHNFDASRFSRPVPSSQEAEPMDPDGFSDGGISFKGSRFSDSTTVPTKNHLVAAAPDFLGWGYGRRACPGRFFAAMELKLLLAHIVTNYDVKLKEEGVRPQDLWVEANCLPNMKAEVMFRRRQK
ncbi:hypothetical protein HGRIS_008136 [Hohenbuehelia grisea]|uniref:Cytochrome P450 n=1 Tax=Hohenbuehelia grisea TaxID=104357 RepID=A0ABR3J798_9AGAR